jgi:hypothetical protein
VALQGPGAALPASVIHDTVAAVVRDPAFHRDLQQSLWSRLFQWLGELWSWLVGALGRSGLARPLGYALLALLVIAIVLRLFVVSRAADQSRPARATRRRDERVDELLALARRLAADGRFEEAAHALYRAVLLSVARTERLRLDASKTSGDYARELRARGSPAGVPFRAFARRFDDGVFGHGGCDARLIDDLERLADPLLATRRAA